MKKKEIKEVIDEIYERGDKAKASEELGISTQCFNSSIKNNNMQFQRLKSIFSFKGFKIYAENKKTKQKFEL